MNIWNNKVSIILCGGIGNNLFQIAALLAYSRTSGYQSIFGYWKSDNSETPLSVKERDWPKNPYFGKWAGHPVKDENMTLKNLFPALPWFKEQLDTIKEVQKWAYGYEEEGTKYHPLTIKPGEQVQGYFFNHLYWHPP